MDNQLLSEKKIILTGDGGLLGSHLCNYLLSQGAYVFGIDLEYNRGKKHSHYMRLEGDITNMEFVKSVTDLLKNKYGSVDVIINNAAINDAVENKNLDLESSKFENFPLELWTRSLAVNLTGPFLLCQKSVELLKKSKNPSIINIASTYGMVAPKQDLYKDSGGAQFFYKGPAYSVSKAGLIMFTKFLASYLGKYNIRANSVSPGGIENGQDEYFVKQYSSRTLIGRMAQASDYEGIIEFLISSRSKYLTGANIPVDGGWTTT